MVKRQVFFSFHYDRDNWRASQIKEMGAVSDDSTFSANDWEEVKKKSDQAIKRWIDDQMAMRSCIVVLIGRDTSTRKWVIYEIKKAMELHKGIVGIYIHKLKDREGNQDSKGRNPFYDIITDNGKRLSSLVEAYDSTFSSSPNVYNDIKEEIGDLIEKAINNKDSY